MKARKAIPGFFDDRQVEAMSEALDRVMAALRETGSYPQMHIEAFRERVARTIVDLATGNERDADYLAHLTLETIIHSKRARSAEQPVSRSARDEHRGSIGSPMSDGGLPNITPENDDIPSRRRA